MWATGRNRNGQLGDGSKTDKRNFMQLFASEAKVIGAGGYHSMVVKEDGSVWATGSNKHGQIGHASTTSQKTFASIDTGALHEDVVAWNLYLSNVLSCRILTPIYYRISIHPSSQPHH